MENFADTVIEQSIPAAIEILKEFLLAVWNEDYPYIIAFLLFVLLYIFINKILEEKHRY